MTQNTYKTYCCEYNIRNGSCIYHHCFYIYAQSVTHAKKLWKEKFPNSYKYSFNKKVTLCLGGE